VQTRPWPVSLRCEARAPWPLRLPGAGPDGLLRRRGAVLERLVHVEGEAVVVAVAQTGAREVVLRARAASTAGAGEGIARMRQALGVDDDVRPFHERFRDDPLVGRALRADPLLRVPRRPEPFEALAWAVCEQLIDYERALAIQRRLIARLGRRCPLSGLRDAPSAAALAAASPALLCSLGLGELRAQALRRAAGEVACGRVDLRAPEPERAWARLARIPGIGPWTLEMLALHGQGRLDQVPAGDLNLLKLVGRLRTGRPGARASTEEVREHFAAYHPYGGLAAIYAVRAGAAGGAGGDAGGRGRLRSPARAGTRWSGPGRRWAAA